MKYFLELAYHGKAYHGWQKQPHAISVQEVVEEALFTIWQEPVEIMGAGRTDAGVHARQLFAHFDSEKEPGDDLAYKLNSLLPHDVAVSGVYRVKAEAHARFDALSRSYEYHIVKKKDPFAIDTAYYIRKELQVEKMQEAAKILLDYRDFKCFSRSRTDVRTFNCDIHHAYWEVQQDRLVFHIKADRFLRNMVRAIVGTLLQVGLGKIGVEDMHRIIQSKDRSEAGASVPAHGLFLTKIEYPNTIFI